MIGPEARGAWKELEQRLRPYLARRVASPADVDDLLQDIFVRMHQGLANLRDDERFGPWVYRIAHSAVVDRSRRRSRSPITALADAEVSAEGPSDEELRSDLSACLALFVSILPEPYRQAITLTELQGHSQQAAADMLEISLSGMKSRVQRGRDKLRHMFEECCQLSVDVRGRVIECEPRGIEDVAADCKDAAACWAGRARPS
jgi:RNA polymerase sigma-70 factor (ECF subfamily)